MSFYLRKNQIKNYLSQKGPFVIIGLINIVLFHYAILRLFFFLYESSGRQTTVSPFKAIVVNSLLIIFFSVPHSILLQSATKKKFLNYIPNTLYSTFYSLHACVAIILMDEFWVDFGGSLYTFEGPLRVVFNGLYILSWLFMLWAMISTGLLRQSGIEEWYQSLRGKKIKNSLASTGAYGLCRHPIYAAFIAMMWSTPNMSYDHLFLSLGWLFYILWGAGQKERRLMRNTLYKTYANQIPAFPFIGKIGDAILLKLLWRIS